MKYSVITFGCRVNQADSLGFEEAFLEHGARAADVRDADIVVVNTCSVTASADQAARQTVRRIARENPSARIVVTGCYATREPDVVAQLPGVTCVTPNEHKAVLVPLVMKAAGAASTFRAAELTTAERFAGGEGSCGASIEPGVAGRTAFTLRVQTGCAEPCAYCIIPSTRGRPVSVPISTLLHQIDRIILAGYKEIALTGVHLGSYGRDLTPTSSLLGLLCAIEHALEGTGVVVRISSLEPMDCRPDIVDVVVNSSVFAPHFHLPLQHASDQVLQRMRRPYTSAYYSDLVSTIRERLPDASIGSDVIVGFPGETDSDFDQLTSYLANSPLTHVHVFPYSDRPGTAASSMRGKVPGDVVRERARTVRNIADGLTRRFRESQLGAVRRGLTLEDGSLVVTDNYLKVRIAPGLPRNQQVLVRVTDTSDPLRGELLTASE